MPVGKSGIVWAGLGIIFGTGTVKREASDGKPVAFFFLRSFTAWIL
jgi:hypothetical protein